MKKKEKVVEELDEEMEFKVNGIDRLAELQVNQADLNKFKSAGYCTVTSVLMATKKELLKIKGITEAKIDKVQEAAVKLENKGYSNGLDMLQKRKNIRKISTGSEKLDALLGGGVESMSITEAFGEFRTGKTQLCHTLAVTAQLPREEGGGGGKVIFIDAEGTFRPEKIVKIAERFDIDPEDALKNIVYARAYTTEYQANLITLAAAKMMEEEYALVIVDSIMALFRVDYSGRGELSDRQRMLGKTLSKLMKLAEQFNVAVLLTNHVMSDPGATMTFTADPKKPIGGHVLAHASTTRLYLRKGKGDCRVCKIYDAPNLPESDAVFRLSDAGITDEEA